MISALPPENEEARLAELDRFAILDTPPEDAFDDIAVIASEICQTPIALISFIDTNRQWFKAKVGLSASETPREFSFCAHAILNPNDLFIIPDTSSDPRFANNPLVTGEPHIRFYAGAPLVTSNGFPLGSLCVIDRNPRTLTTRQLTALRSLRRQVVNELELRYSLAELKQIRSDLTKSNELLEQQVKIRTTELAFSLELLQGELAERENKEKALLASEEKYRTVFETTGTATVLVEDDGTISMVNGEFEKIFGFSKDEIEGKRKWTEFSIPEELETLLEYHRKRRINPASVPKSYEAHFNDKEGNLRVLHITTAIIPGTLTSIASVQDITEQKQRENEIRRYNEDLTALNRIVTACTSSLDLKTLLDRVLDEALGITGLEGGTICLVTPNNTLELAACRETSEATIADLTSGEIRVGDCLCGECALDHSPLILRNREDVLKFASREATRNEDIRFHAAYPLMIGGTCAGVLCVFTRTDFKPGERSLKLLETVTGQVAMAIENARLYAVTAKHAALLEEKVAERTAELTRNTQELERMNKLFVGRELRMIELKEKLKQLEKQVA